MVKPAARDQHGQQIRLGGDHLVVQPPHLGDLLEVAHRLGELQPAVEEHHRDVRINLAGKVDDHGGILTAAPGHEPVMLIKVRSNPIEQLLVAGLSAPARGDPTQHMKIRPAVGAVIVCRTM